MEQPCADLLGSRAPPVLLPNHFLRPWSAAIGATVTALRLVCAQFWHQDVEREPTFRPTNAITIKKSVPFDSPEPYHLVARRSDCAATFAEEKERMTYAVPFEQKGLERLMPLRVEARPISRWPN